MGPGDVEIADLFRTTSYIVGSLSVGYYLFYLAVVEK